MKKEIYVEAEIPSGIEVRLDDSMIIVKGPEGENKKKLSFANLEYEIKDGKVIIGNKRATKNEKKLMNTNISHIKNMILGVQKKFVNQLKVCFQHFPITVEVHGKDILIKNFLGEKTPRKTYIPEGAEVKVNKDIITVSSTDKETAGQAAANLEAITRISSRDRRVFQDGIFITSKNGVAI